MEPGATSNAPKTRLVQWPWYPFVVAIYPLWFLFLSNSGQASLGTVLDATTVALAATLVLAMLAGKLTASIHIGALVVTVFIVCFYAYGPLHDFAVRLAVHRPHSQFLRAIGQIFENHVALSSLLLGLLAFLIWLIVVRADRNSTRVTGACNVAAATLGAILLTRVLLGAMDSLGDGVKHDRAVTGAGNKTSVLGYNPDIYYIILDGYARADVLRDYYDFDNGPFIAGLKQRGFTVNDRSSANYNHTFLSLASSLNFDYLQDIATETLDDPEMQVKRQGFAKIAELLQDNRAAHFLRARGYRFVHLQSSSPETVRNPYADEQVSCAGRVFDDEYFRAVAEISWLKALAPESMVTDDLAECHKLRLQALGNQASRPGPKFVFAHFMPPHHPYLFDKDGNVLRKATISNQFDYQARLWEDKSGYLGQLQYLNTSVTEVVDRILAQSKQPPIIIVQSDHGPNLRDGLSIEQMHFLRLANFAAYFLPGAPPGTLPADCAPVNQFRYLFNHYFAAELPVLPFRSFFSEFKTPLQMTELPPSATGQP
jgi:hypothetical protein